MQNLRPACTGPIVVLEQTASREERNESLAISDGKAAKTASRKFDRKSCNAKRRMHASKFGMENSVFRKEARVRGMVVEIEEYGLHAFQAMTEQLRLKILRLQGHRTRKFNKDLGEDLQSLQGSRETRESSLKQVPFRLLSCIVTGLLTSVSHNEC